MNALISLRFIGVQADYSNLEKIFPNKGLRLVSCQEDAHNPELRVEIEGETSADDFHSGSLIALFKEFAIENGISVDGVIVDQSTGQPYPIIGSADADMQAAFRELNATFRWSPASR